MDEEGLVTSKEGTSEIGPTRRIYKRTAKGRKELLAWLSGGPVVGTERIAYPAQVYFLSDLEDNARAIAYMQELREYMLEWLHTLEATEKQWKSCEPGYPDDIPNEDFHSQLTLDMGLRKVRANVEWCEDSIARIRRRESKSVRSA